MLYREVGQFKTSYASDEAIFPIRQDRWLVVAALAVAYLAIPALGSEYWLLTIMVPFLVYALAALGLNLLTGYAGQVSLGTGGFMAVGAFATYKLATAFPGLNIVVILLFAGIITAMVGALFGFPSLRIKGFYLAVATLAAQFFLIWLFNKFPWFYNYSSSGVISAPPRAVFGHFYVTGAEADPRANYLLVLTVAPRLIGTGLPVNILTNLEAMIFGALIVLFLIVEPRGLARLWQIGKEKLRLWPFPH